ncbi:hypothetical protein U1Q18_043917 [Sarracenia purpurea var. burkii]
MEDTRSVNSPRRVLSLSGKRTETLLFTEPDDKASGFGASGEHGPKPSEVYGFVGSISTVVATDILPLMVDCVLGAGSANLCNGDNIISHWILYWPQLHGDPASKFLEHNLR